MWSFKFYNLYMYMYALNNSSSLKHPILHCINLVMSVSPAVIVHGGAWAIPDELAQPSVDGVKRAARAGFRVLENGGSVVDAVEAAVRVLEDDPAFDAGTGSVLNAAGEVEMDAIIMEGRDLSTGAVACVENIKNPITLARKVMEKTDHTLIVGKGANAFAKEVGIDTVSQDELVTETAKKEWETYMKFKNSVNVLFRNRSSGDLAHPSVLHGHDTVGAVAVDCQGHIACGTSTGGITAKRPGRVGDSPLVGCGAYADDNTGGVSTTGHGESISKMCLAKQITDFMDAGLSPNEACEKSLEMMSSRVGGSGGAIVLSNKGETGLSFTTERMAWAWSKEGKLHYGLNHEEDFQEDL